MPAVKPIKLLWLRVDTHDEDSIRKYIQLYVNKTYIVALHNGKDGSNPHFHMACELKDATSIQTVRNRVKSHFTVSKDKYCVMEWDASEEVFAYCYHEDDVKLMINNLTNEQIEKAIERNKIVNLPTKSAKKKAIKTKTNWDMIEEIRATVSVTDTNDEIYDKMIVVLEANKVRTSVFDLERWFVTVKRNNIDFNRDLKNKIISKVYS